MILHPSFVLPVMERETPVGYASRMALKMGCSLRVFCKRTGIPLQELLDGRPSAVALLRHLCQLPERAFADTTYVVAPGHRFFLAGQELSRDQVSREALRICPVCVERQISDGRDLHEISSPREWQLAPLYVCDIHAVPILAINERDIVRSGRQDFSRLLREALMQGRFPTGEIQHVTESGLGHHVRRRLRGVDDGHWLSRMPLYAAIKTAEMIGVAALHGVRKTSLELDIAERFEAGRVGYEILGEGDLGLRELFTGFQQDYSSETSATVLHQTFGRIYVNMASWRDAAFDPLRDVLRQHLIETLSFGPGEILLGKEVTERRIHSARTAALELGLSPITARRRLRSIGVLAEASEIPTWEQNFFDARTHAGDIRRLSGALQRGEAIRYLGPKRMHHGFSPILDLIGSMNVDKTILFNQIFAKEDLDAFLASVLGKASTGPIEGFDTIDKAARRLRTGIANVLDMIMKDEITDVRLSPAHEGIGSLMVRKKDLYSALVARRPWVTILAGARAIKMKDMTLTALVKSKIIPSKGVSPVMLNPEDLEAFARTYVSRREVAHQYRQLRGTTIDRSMTKAIAMAGLEPAFDERKTTVKFYRRDAVLAAFGPPPH